MAAQKEETAVWHTRSTTAPMRREQRLHEQNFFQTFRSPFILRYRDRYCKSLSGYFRPKRRATYRPPQTNKTKGSSSGKTTIPNQMAISAKACKIEVRVDVASEAMAEALQGVGVGIGV